MIDIFQDIDELNIEFKEELQQNLEEIKEIEKVKEKEEKIFGPDAHYLDSLKDCNYTQKFIKKTQFL